MADHEVKVPGVGPVKKKWAIAGGAAVVLIVGVAYMRHKSAANAAAASAATPATGGTATTPAPGGTSQYPSDGTTGNPSDPYSVDPATGITYGDEGNQGGFYNQGYAAQSPALGYDQYSGYGGYYYGNTNPTTNNTISTNEQWLTQSENDLQGVGYDQATAAAALSKVLAGLPVSAAQKAIFEQALGIDGNPPQGYPTPIKLTSTPGQPGGGNTGKVKVPYVVGLDEGHAAANLSNAGLHPHGPPVHQVRGQYQQVTGQSPSAGTLVSKGSTVSLTVKVVKT